MSPIDNSAPLPFHLSQADNSAPIPFHLSQSVESVSPLSPAQCSSSPETKKRAPVHDSFTEAFTSIKNTDDSGSTRFPMLEGAVNSISSQSLQSLNESSSFSNEMQCDSCNVSSNMTSETGAVLHHDNLHHSSTEEENIKTPDQKVQKKVPMENKPKKTRFQSIVRSHSATYERSPMIASDNMPGLFYC